MRRRLRLRPVGAARMDRATGALRGFELRAVLHRRLHAGLQRERPARRGQHELRLLMQPCCAPVRAAPPANLVAALQYGVRDAQPRGGRLHDAQPFMWGHRIVAPVPDHVGPDDDGYRLLAAAREAGPRTHLGDLCGRLCFHDHRRAVELPCRRGLRADSCIPVWSDCLCLAGGQRSVSHHRLHGQPRLLWHVGRHAELLFLHLRVADGRGLRRDGHLVHVD